LYVTWEQFDPAACSTNPDVTSGTQFVATVDVASAAVQRVTTVARVHGAGDVLRFCGFADLGVIETAPGHARSAAWISSVERGRRTSATSTGLSCETSLTVVLPARAGEHGTSTDKPDAAAAWRILRRLGFTGLPCSSAVIGYGSGQRKLNGTHSLP